MLVDIWEQKKDNSSKVSNCDPFLIQLTRVLNEARLFFQRLCVAVRAHLAEASSIAAIKCF
jgi:hypothetical protein